MIAAIRIRGLINVNRDIEATMKMLHLTRPNHLTLIQENPSYMGMLQKVKDYITYGEIDNEVLIELIRERGILIGNKKVTEDYIREQTTYDSIEAFARAMIEDNAEYRELPNVKPLFRLHPPRKGYKSVKRHFKAGGSLGNRGTAINDLIRRML